MIVLPQNHVTCFLKSENVLTTISSQFSSGLATKQILQTSMFHFKCSFSTVYFLLIAFSISSIFCAQSMLHYVDLISPLVQYWRGPRLYVSWVNFWSLSEILFFCFLQVRNFSSVKIKFQEVIILNPLHYWDQKYFDWFVIQEEFRKYHLAICFVFLVSSVLVALFVLTSVLTVSEFYFSIRVLFLLRSFLMQKNKQTSPFNLELVLYAGSKFKSLLVLPFPYECSLIFYNRVFFPERKNMVK